MKRSLALIALVPLLLANGEPDDPAQETEHTVKAGETLGGIAQRAVVQRTLIIEANGLTEPYALKAGQKLVIPRRRTHSVKAGETGFEIALQYGIPWEDIATANSLDPKAPLKAGAKLAIPTITKVAEPATAPTPAPSPAVKPAMAATPNSPRFLWPVPGKVLRGFTPGTKGQHRGIDLAGPEGSAVRAVAAGKVIFAGMDDKLGNLVILDHGQGWVTAYAKLQKVTVTKGDKARSGERVGLLGNTGENPRMELHFEVRRYNLPVDPEKVLPARDQAKAQNTVPVAR